MEEIWLQREDESDDMYLRFINYYLILEKPNLIESYNLYAYDNSLEEVRKVSEVPKVYRNLASKYRWNERALAYKKKYLTTYTPSQQNYISQTITDIQASIKTWRNLNKSLTTLSEDERDSPKISTTKTLVYALEKFVSARAKLDEMARRTLNLPTMINSDVAPMDSDQTDEAKIEWNEIETSEEHTEDAKKYVERLMADREKRLSNE